jgi:murein L,D-transpeptidase YcbB/YkuD
VASPAVASPAVASPAAAAPAQSGWLDAHLPTLSRDTSYGAAVARVQATWGSGSPLERTELRTHLPQVKRLDLPALFEMFHPSRRDTCFLALLGLSGDHALVALGTEPPARVPMDELDRYWTRNAVFYWRDFDLVSRREDTAQAAAWTRDQLGRLGYGARYPEAVERFQREHDLIADGVIGSRTLMTLYTRGDWPRPRLSSAPPEAHGGEATRGAP